MISRSYRFVGRLLFGRFSPVPSVPNPSGPVPARGVPCSRRWEIRFSVGNVVPLLLMGVARTFMRCSSSVVCDRVSSSCCALLPVPVLVGFSSGGGGSGLARGWLIRRPCPALLFPVDSASGFQGNRTMSRLTTQCRDEQLRAGHR